MTSNQTAEETYEARVSLRKMTLALKDPSRWKILRELAKGEPLPVIELARRVGRAQDSVSKHMMILKEAGIVVQGYGRLYRFAPTCQQIPGTMNVDIGICILKLGSLP